jgi:hypothetical protein
VIRMDECGLPPPPFLPSFFPSQGRALCQAFAMKHKKREECDEKHKKRGEGAEGEERERGFRAQATCSAARPEPSRLGNWARQQP